MWVRPSTILDKMIDLTAIVLALAAGLSLIGIAWIWGFWDARAKTEAKKRRQAVRTVRRLSAPIATPRQRARAALAELQRRMLVKVPPDTSKLVMSPMPGLLTNISVQVGESVTAGQKLAAIEAMDTGKEIRSRCGR